MPDTVSVSITNYQFLRFAGFMKLPPVTIPPFTTSVPMESAGYQDASGDLRAMTPVSIQRTLRA